MHEHYRQRYPLIVQQLEDSLTLAAAHFAERLPQHPLERLRAPIRQELDALMHDLPYVGGDQGRMTPFFEQGAGALALGRVLRSLQTPEPVVQALMRETFLARLKHLPLAERERLGRQFLSEENQAFLRAQARRSHDRENEGDFVYEFVEPAPGTDAEGYAFGIDYRECGFCKLCKATGDEDLLPHLCAVDKEFYAVRGIELHRSTTLAGGARRCDFRFRAANPGTPS